ncbi:MAG: M48 family metalloprotease [Candidatus Eremiobacteraeota bacterium]|nr:M48 family metalloprotease [Candidatus Eremiobacteraeota bacterium]
MRHSLPLLALIIALFVIAAMPASAGISESEETTIGKQGAAQLEAKFGLYADAAQVLRLENLGKKIIPVTERRGLGYTFKILNTDNVNALALPGGFVYVTKGLLPLVTEEELGFVLGHEIAHVSKRHSIHQLEKQMWTDIGLVTLAAVLNKGQISQGSATTIQAASLIINSQYSRDDEREADVASCVYMVAGLGFNPRAGASFMRKMKKAGGGELPGFVNSLIGSHPLTDERIKVIEEEASRMGY